MNIKFPGIAGAVFLIAFSFSFHAADFEARILNAPHELPLGAPVIVVAQVRNISGKGIPIINKWGGGFQVHLVTHWTDGRATKAQLSSARKKRHYGFEQKTLPADWSQWVSSDDLESTDRPGELIVQLVVESHGPYMNRNANGEETIEVKGWNGEVRSEEIHIQVREPRGVDKEIYEASSHCPRCWHFEKLQKYPESIYAAYSWFGQPCLPGLKRPRRF